MARPDVDGVVLFAGNDLLAVRRESDREHRRCVDADVGDQTTLIDIP